MFDVINFYMMNNPIFCNPLYYSSVSTSPTTPYLATDCINKLNPAYLGAGRVQINPKTAMINMPEIRIVDWNHKEKGLILCEVGPKIQIALFHKKKSIKLATDQINVM